MSEGLGWQRGLFPNADYRPLLSQPVRDAARRAIEQHRQADGQRNRAGTRAAQVLFHAVQVLAGSAEPGDQLLALDLVMTAGWAALPEFGRGCDPTPLVEVAAAVIEPWLARELLADWLGERFFPRQENLSREKCAAELLIRLDAAGLADPRQVVAGWQRLAARDLLWPYRPWFGPDLLLDAGTPAALRLVLARAAAGSRLALVAKARLGDEKVRRRLAEAALATLEKKKAMDDPEFPEALANVLDGKLWEIEPKLAGLAASYERRRLDPSRTAIVLARAGRKEGFALLVDAMEWTLQSANPMFFGPARRAYLRTLEEHTGQSFGADLAAWRRWLTDSK